jgi:ActR/RegA family two-component response regulator
MSLKSNQWFVLIVDDQENWRDQLADLLDDDDLAVTKVATLKEAWDAVFQKKDPPFHVVVTDIRLKDYEKGNEDGMRLTEMLNRLGDATKVIVVTGFPTLATAKRSIGHLAAYDYLEKVPENGTPFDADGFHDLVRRAAEAAERERPDGFTLPRLWVLLIDGEANWRKKMVELLKDRLYDVDVIENADCLAERLEKDKKVYHLVIFHEIVSRDQKDFFGTLEQYLPDVKKIMFTDQDIEPVVRLMQEKVILNVFAVRDGWHNKPAFEETLRRAFVPEATRYAFVRIFDTDSPEQPFPEMKPLLVGHKYHLELVLQNARQPGAVAVWLLPKAEKRSVSFRVFIYAPNMVLDPDSGAYWKIAASGQIRPFVMDVIPQAPGTVPITIELEQDNGWAWRLTRQIVVENSRI